jgi:hypothetical protein
MKMNDREVKLHKNAIDWTDVQVGRLVVNKLLGKHAKRRTLIWSAVCSCGNETKVTSAELSAGHTKSCGCLYNEILKQRNEEFAEKYKTHGMAGTAEQKAWKRIKQRCLNPKCDEYEVYSKIGISKAFAEDFMNFYNDIGPIPDNFTGRVSVDRIENSLGYVEGNVRWANDEMQARNKGMYANNSSGITGVRLHVGKNGKTYWTASWYPKSGKSKTKYFSVDKYGDELAFFAACEMRSLMIERLNLAGAGYSENHGK